MLSQSNRLCVCRKRLNFLKQSARRSLLSYKDKATIKSCKKAPVLAKIWHSVAQGNGLCNPMPAHGYWPSMDDSCNVAVLLRSYWGLFSPCLCPGTQEALQKWEACIQGHPHKEKGQLCKMKRGTPYTNLRKVWAHLTPVPNGATHVTSMPFLLNACLYKVRSVFTIESFHNPTCFYMSPARWDLLNAWWDRLKWDKISPYKIE